MMIERGAEQSRAEQTGMRSNNKRVVEKQQQRQRFLAGYRGAVCRPRADGTTIPPGGVCGCCCRCRRRQEGKTGRQARESGSRRTQAHHQHKQRRKGGNGNGGEETESARASEPRRDKGRGTDAHGRTTGHAPPPPAPQMLQGKTQEPKQKNTMRDDEGTALCLWSVCLAFFLSSCAVVVVCGLRCDIVRYG